MVLVGNSTFAVAGTRLKFFVQGANVTNELGEGDECTFGFGVASNMNV